MTGPAPATAEPADAWPPVDATLRGMARVRISTTVDEGRLTRCRRLLGVSDSALVDRALIALLDEIEARRELVALAEHPYEADPDLNWEAPSGPAPPYEGDVPPAVVALAEQRRRG